MRLQSTAQLAAKKHASKLGFPRSAAAEVAYNVTKRGGVLLGATEALAVGQDVNRYFDTSTYFTKMILHKSFLCVHLESTNIGCACIYSLVLDIV
jgi:hypothetical protein